MGWGSDFIDGTHLVTDQVKNACLMTPCLVLFSCPEENLQDHLYPPSYLPPCQLSVIRTVAENLGESS